MYHSYFNLFLILIHVCVNHVLRLISYSVNIWHTASRQLEDTEPFCVFNSSMELYYLVDTVES